MKTCVIYRRVSSKRQSEEGKSLADQDAELELYCKAMGYDIIGNFEDAVSGRREKTEKRKGLARALEMVCQHKATLIVYDLDRLARSQSIGMKIVEPIKDCGAKLVIKSLGIDTNTPSGEMFVGIMFAFAQWGSKNIGEGVKRANRQSVREKGYRTQGAQPFGWKIVNGERVKVPAEQELLTTVKAYRRKHKSLYATAKALREDNIPTPDYVRYGRESTWHHRSVKKLTD